MRRFFFALLALCSARAVQASSVSPSYTVTEIRPPQHFALTYPTSINDLGEVSGYSADFAKKISNAFVYDSAKYQTVTPTGGRFGFYIADLNDSGEGIGFDQKSDQSLIWTSKGKTPLTRPGSASFDAQALRINNAGDAVGSGIDPASGALHAIWWHDGKAADLPTLGGHDGNLATAINDKGAIVGTSSTRAGETRAVLWEHRRVEQLATLGGSYSIPSDINNNGAVVGNANTRAGADHVFLWQSGKISDLGKGTAAAINDTDVIVGFESGHAMMWESNKSFDLNDLLPATSGWSLALATDINNNGQIVGIGTYKGRGAAFLLSPVSSAAATAIPLPDPSAMGVAAIPFLWLSTWLLRGNNRSTSHK